MDIRTKAIMLRRVNYGEADRILTVLTPEGKMSVMAKGVRRAKAKLAGAVELFSLSDVVIHKGKSDMGVLTSARLLEFYEKIMEDYATMEFAGEALRAVSRRSEHADSPEYFEILQQTLAGANEVGASKTVMGWFWLNLLRVSGEEVNMRVDMNGKKLQTGVKYMWDRQEGALVENARGEIGEGEIKLARVMMSSPLKVVLRVVGAEERVGAIEMCYTSGK